MNDELKARIEAIKESCRLVLSPLMGLHCHKCDTWYEAEPGKKYESGVFCQECRDRGYTLVGVCHLEKVLETNRRGDPKQARALLTVIEALETLYWSITGQFSSDAIVLSKRAKRCLEQIARDWEEPK